MILPVSFIIVFPRINVFLKAVCRFFSLQTLLMAVVFTIVAVSQCQKLGRNNKQLLFNGWLSYDFGGKWGTGLGAVLRFKRSTDAVCIKRHYYLQIKINVLRILCRYIKEPFTPSLKRVIFIQSCIECIQLSIEFNRFCSIANLLLINNANKNKRICPFYKMIIIFFLLETFK